MSNLKMSNRSIIETVESLYGDNAASRHGVPLTGGDVYMKIEGDLAQDSKAHADMLQCKENIAKIYNKVESDFSAMMEGRFATPSSVSNEAFDVSKSDAGFNVRAGFGGQVTPAALGFVNEMSKGVSVMKGESFDGIQTRSAKAASLAVNISFERAPAFERVLFPKYFLEDDKTTLDITQNIPVFIEHAALTINNIASDFKDQFRSIALLMWSDELTKSNTTKVHHIISSTKDQTLKDARKDYLEETLKRSVEVKGTAVEVAPIKVFKDGEFNSVNIVNVSTISYHNEDVKSERDTLHNVVTMKEIFVKISAGDAANGQGQPLSVIYKLSCGDRRGNLFAKRAEQESKLLTLNGPMSFSIDNLAAIKEYDTVSDKNSKENAPFTNLVGSVGGLKIDIIPNLDLAIDSGKLDINGFTVKVSGNKDAITTAKVKVEAVAFNLNATFTNTNFREVGQLIGNAKITLSYGIDWKDPVSVQGPIKDMGNGAATTGNVDLERSINLGTVLAMQSSVYAVRTFLEFRDNLASFTQPAKEHLEKMSVLKPSQRTLSYGSIIPFWKKETHNVANTNSLTSAELLEDIRNNIKNYIGQVADEMLQQSRYTNALRLVDGDVNKKPCLVIVTSENNSKYIVNSEVTDPDVLTPKPLNRNMDYVVVSIPSDGETYNAEFQNNIFLTFVEPHVLQSGTISAITPITFGFTLCKNALTYDFQRTAEESVKFISALPIYKHYVHLPVMTQIELTGLSGMVKEKTSILFENKFFKNAADIK